MTYNYLSTLFSGLRRRRLALAAGILAAGCLSTARAQTSDIRSFGARCDGSDDSGAVNAAFSSLPNGGTLQISCRVGVSEAAMRDKSAVTIEGVSGGGFIAVGSNPARVLIRVENCDRCAIRNLVIDGNGRDAAGLGIFYSSNTTVENNQVSNVSYPAMAGIVARGNRNNRYVGNFVMRMIGDENNGVRGMWIGNGSAGSSDIEWNPTIANNTVRDASATGLVGHWWGRRSRNTVDRTGSGIKVVPPNGQGGRLRS
jgi:hypothetical protein